MATTYGERRDALTRMQVTLKTSRDQLTQAATIVGAVKANLDALPTSLKTLLEDIASDKGQSNVAYQVMSGEAEILLAEVQALSSEADAKAKAMDAAG